MASNLRFVANQHVTNSMKKFIFMRRKINVKVSQNEKSTCNQYEEQKKLERRKFKEQN